MAVIKVTKGGKSLKSVINYVERKAQLVSGKDCSDNPNLAKEEMQLTKQLYEKTDGRQYKHYIQSFAPGEIEAQKAHELGKEWAEKVFQGYEVFIATHTDKEHVHNHFVVNSVNFETGYKFQSSKKDLEHLKKQNDLLCERAGLSIPENKKDLQQAKGEVRTYDMGKYQLLKRIAQNEKIKSFVLDTAHAVNEALEQTTSKEMFIEKMQKQGYQVDWQEHKKHITFTTPEGKKVRASNLAKTFSDNKFMKEGMLDEFARFSRRERPEKEYIHTEMGGNDPGRAGSIDREYRDLATGQASPGSLKAGRTDLTDQSLGNIQRQIHELQERTGQDLGKSGSKNKSPQRRERGFSR